MSMSLPGRASRRFHAAPRSRPVALLVGGIGAAFALVLAVVLLGGAPPVDVLPEIVAELEAKARKAEAEGRLEEAVGHVEALIQAVAGRDAYRTAVVEWRARLRTLKEEIVLVRRADEAFAAFKKECAAATAANARTLWDRGQQLRRGYGESKRPWLAELDVLLRGLEEKMKSTAPPSWQEQRRKILDGHRLEQKGEAQWGAALKAWDAYLALKIEDVDRRGAEGDKKLIELRARGEAVSLLGKNPSVEELRKQRTRFDGTQAVAELDKAIGAK